MLGKVTSFSLLNKLISHSKNKSVYNSFILNNNLKDPIGLEKSINKSNESRDRDQSNISIN